MALVVHSNLSSLSAARHLSQTQADLGRSLSRISSGKRVVRAADDAAGLAVATNLTTQARSLRIGMRNANDGISMIQTAEGASSQVTVILQRMRELAVQSSSETLDDDERAYIEDELVELSAEVARIAAETEFSGTLLTDGTVTQISVQVGIHNAASSRIDLDLGDLSTSALGVGTSSIDLSSVSGARSAIDGIDDALDSVNGYRSDLGAVQNRLESAISAAEVGHGSLVAAASRIEDADYAHETAEMVRLQIQAQAGVAALVQSRELSRLAIDLLM